MKIFLAIILIHLSNIDLVSQNLLYKSDAFSIYSDRVTQGEFEAKAVSRNRLISNYKSAYKASTRKLLVFKFSINGFDNERFPGEDHLAILRSKNGVGISSLYKFGFPDPELQSNQQKNSEGYINEDMDFVIRVDMRSVLKELRTKGFYTTVTGDKIMAKSFDGVYVAGGTSPLTWDFRSLPSKPEFKLEDIDGDGIYEVTVKIKKYQQAEARESEFVTWSLTKDISQYPEYRSTQIISDALYNKSLEEMILNMQEDGTFMAGAKWPGVWTRDISYSILLSLAIINPDASKKSLVAKVNNDRIIQDTGTGGSWPISTDRITWTLAAWEVYTVTGDRHWLEYAYDVIKNSVEDDLKVTYNPSMNLFYGESSFLDWREQTYPHWMEPTDIYQSHNLGTNAVFYEAFNILDKMEKVLDIPSDSYRAISELIKMGINEQLWMEDIGYYGQYIYGRNFQTLSPKSETLGESLTVLFDIADEKQQMKIIESLPVSKFGVTCIFPQIPNIPPYHNNGIWPFVVAYWTWASAKVENVKSVEHGLASIYRAAALFLTNKENIVASTGDFMGTEINSDRQLWSVAGNLAMIYRVFYGMSFSPDELTLTPFIPKPYAGKRMLKNLKYRNANITIIINGFGSKIASVTLDGKAVKKARIPHDLEGNHKLIINMANDAIPSIPINLVNNKYSPEMVTPSLDDSVLKWHKVRGVRKYMIYRNGEIIGESTKESFPIKPFDDYAEYQIATIDNEGYQSFLSEPIITVPERNVKIIQIEEIVESKAQQKYAGYSGTGYIELDKGDNQNARFITQIDQAGIYSIEFRYANGNGPINTNNKCAIRTLFVNGEPVGAIVMPQRGVDLWTDWGYTNSIRVSMSKGMQTIELKFTDSNHNMNRKVNSALLDGMRLTLLNRN